MSEETSGSLPKKKLHRERQSGRKAERKKKKDSKNEQGPSEKQPNPKAFAFNSAVKAERRFRRKQDIETKKQHIPVVDRSPVEPPPILVGIVGPPKVGKSTLINSLIKLFTKSPLTDIKGPVTIVTGKKRRITLIECNNDINSMIDLAKVADLILLLCDASFGFEMEVFEFLNICQVHGMPRIMGVLTHLDTIKNSKALKTTKKTLKHRFWTEVYAGAKLFYLSGILHGEYLRNEIKNLGRFMSVIKLRPLVWRASHSYLVGDRYEDLTSQESVRKNSKCDRNISLYGYVRGIPLNKNSSVHLAGLGDLKIHDISFLPDPCPLLDAIKKRALIEKERLIYAPFSGVGGIVYDKDAVYVELGGSHSHKQQNDNETSNLVANLIATQEALDVKMGYSEMKLFSEGETLTAKDLDVDGLEPGTGNTTQVEDKVLGETNAELDDDTSGSEEDGASLSEESVDDIEDDLEVKWKENLAKKAGSTFLNQQNKTQNLMKLVYGVFENSTRESATLKENQENGPETEIGGLFRVVSHEQQKQKTTKENMNSVESSLPEPWTSQVRNWLDFENKTLIANCFVTGKWKNFEDASELLKLDDMEGADSDGSEAFGDFEDLETGEKFVSSSTKEPKLPEEDKKRKRSSESEKDEDEENLDKTGLAEKKRKLKEMFDNEYDNTEKDYYNEVKTTVEKQSQLNKTIFENMADEVRVEIEGYRPGMYVRIEFQNVPAEFVNNFDPTYPLVVGALNMGEENIGFVNTKIKKHRWFNRILKTNDPLIISLGWRRFQTLPIFSKLEDDLKFRHLKYTPQHVTCNAHFWGPITPQGTGFLALQSCEENSEMGKQGFRIAATGAVQELDKSTQIMKKLKLIGHPLKIYKKTAFIKGMFNSALEVAQFEGARIKTVSGIRGQIKKSVSKPEGSFRATFEDKIQLSDIVFCRTWFKVNVPQYYNPVITLLLPPEKKNAWRGVRSTGQIKREHGLRNQPNKDSLYTEIIREPKVFKPLVIPSKLQRALPYRDKPKHDVLFSEKKNPAERVAVIREPHEQQVSNMMKMLRASFEQKQVQMKQSMQANMEKHKQGIEAEELKKMKKLRQKKKVVMRAKSKAQNKTSKK